jgi:uncharacterized protein YfeS
VEEFIDECARYGVKIDPKIERIAKLQDLIREAERRKEFLEDEGEPTVVVDTMIDDLTRKLEEAVDGLESE